MSKRTVFTTISPLPGGISRKVVIDFLQNHTEMIDLNPLVKERHPIKPPPEAPDDEISCIWYSMTDRITYLPGGLASGDVSYTCAFHDLPNGIQTHCRAPLNVDIRDKWTLNGTLPGEPLEPVELGIGAPATGLYIREDVDLRCNILMTSFVKKNLTRAHATLVERLVEKAKLVAAEDASIRTSKSPSSAVQEQPQPWASAQATQSYAADGSRRHITQGSKSPPPQLGSPFVAGYQPGRKPSLRYPSPNEAVQGGSAPAYTAHHKSHSQTSFKSRAQAHGGIPFQPPPPLRPGRQPQHYSLPPTARHEPALYPQPLRLRNSSVGSSQAGSDIPGVTSGHPISFRAPTPNSRQSISSEPRVSNDHPDYPQLNPYSGEGSSPDEPLPPRTPQFIAELPGHEGFKKKGAPMASEIDHPAVLRPGGAGMSARLKSPFIAELE
ncbi:hypothetical protein VM1G_04372 [Cytospora mali]|uniref:DUF7053 domain-containing protein n=1 Tax=Cytospora mali TaxID=578113 RepID=A0A194VXB6_CYTMA|nr:hypothetical protein VM1G_04372 [Valsa mali]